MGETGTRRRYERIWEVTLCVPGRLSVPIGTFDSEEQSLCVVRSLVEPDHIVEVESFSWDPDLPPHRRGWLLESLRVYCDPQDVEMVSRGGSSILKRDIYTVSPPCRGEREITFFKTSEENER